MAYKYIHFTDKEGAAAINRSKKLLKASFGPEGSVFATIEGGALVPSVQQTKLGRAKNRNVAVVFTTNLLPDVAFPEEVIWHMAELPISILEITTAENAQKLLNDSISSDPQTDFLQISLHPAFNDFGDWERMPADFVPWTPGKDNKKFLHANKLWSKTKDIEKVREYWENENIHLEYLIRYFVNKEYPK